MEGLCTILPDSVWQDCAQSCLTQYDRNWLLGVLSPDLCTAVHNQISCDTKNNNNSMLSSILVGSVFRCVFVHYFCFKNAFLWSSCSWITTIKRCIHHYYSMSSTCWNYLEDYAWSIYIKHATAGYCFSPLSPGILSMLPSSLSMLNSVTKLFLVHLSSFLL